MVRNENYPGIYGPVPKFLIKTPAQQNTFGYPNFGSATLVIWSQSDGTAGSGKRGSSERERRQVLQSPTDHKISVSYPCPHGYALSVPYLMPPESEGLEK